MEGFFSWDILATFAGASLATGLVTQFVKGILSKVPTQLVSYVIAVLILSGAAIASGDAALPHWLIIPLNAVVVSLSANGGYESMTRIARKGT